MSRDDMTPEDKQQERNQDHHKAGFEQDDRKWLQHHQNSTDDPGNN
jgi:hypothetical protein